MQTPTGDIQSILDPLDIPKEVKADAWDAFHNSRNEAEFRQNFDKLSIPHTVKADLFDAKQFTPEQRIQKITEPLKPKEAPTIADTLSDYLRPVISAGKDVLSGIGGELIGGVPLTVARTIGTVPKSTTPADIGMEQRNTGEKIGGAIERIGEFLVPGGLTEKLAQAGKLGILSRAGLEGISAYGVSGAHGDSNEEAVRNGLISGGLTVAGAAALKGLSRLGKRNELAILKPYKSVLEDVRGAPSGQEGQKLVNDIYKYNLGGSLDQTLTKSESMMDDLEAQLQTALKSQPGAKVNLYKAVNDAALDLQQASTAAKNAPYNKGIQKALVAKIDQIDFLNKLTKGAVNSIGDTDLLLANQFKRGLSKEGSWINGFADPDNQSKQIVANAIYKKVREQIEQAAGQAGQAIQQINQKMADILPIQQAVINRIPVAQRREILGLKEAIGLATGTHLGFGLSLFDRVARSPQASNFFVKTAEGASTIAPRIGRIAVGPAEEAGSGWSIYNIGSKGELPPTVPSTQNAP